MTGMKTLSIDIETYSEASLKDVGVYKYVDAPSFKILLLAYAYDDGPVRILDFASGEVDVSVVQKILQDLQDKKVLKTAFNAQFERVCLDKYFNCTTGPWDCTMIRAWSLGIAGNLASIGARIGLPEDEQKLVTGKNLMRLFSIPRKPTRANGMKTVYEPADKPKEWNQFMTYCIGDVVSERAIRNKLLRFPVLDQERALYQLDQDINDRGIRIDTEMAKAALAINDQLEGVLIARYQEITGLENPKSATDIKQWIKKRTGETVPSITKTNSEDLKIEFKAFPDVVEVLEIRELIGRTAVTKYAKMLETVCDDGRSRGNIQFFGARTGRWAGRLIQLQNLPQNHLNDLETAHDMVRVGDADLLSMVYDDPSDVLRQCIRTAIVPGQGKKFIVADFSAIEARVLAWLAGEQWRMDVFNGDGKIYEASASKMFNVPVQEIHKGHPLRQKGKIAELALGYAGSVGAMKQMGALRMGLGEEELKPIVSQWRESNPAIKQFWYDVENACKKAIRSQDAISINRFLTVHREGGILFITLPSGRRMGYAKPRLQPHSKFEGKDQIVFEDAIGANVKQVETYYGKLTENIVQAVARDCLANAMLALDKAGYCLVFHVHDEVIIEIDKDSTALADVCAIMGKGIPWAKGLPLRADGYECDFYKKD